MLGCIIQNKITKKELLTDICGYSPLIISSGSMSPELLIGDIIIIKECDNYNVGDIVTYCVEDRFLITHRIISKEGTNFVTKGDNNNTSDTEVVKLDNIKGKVIYNSKLLRFLYKYKFIIILIVFLILIFI